MCVCVGGGGGGGGVGYRQCRDIRKYLLFEGFI